MWLVMYEDKYAMWFFDFFPVRECVAIVHDTFLVRGILCFSFSGVYTPHQLPGGVYVWANKYAFDPSLTAPLLSSSPTEPFDMEEPHSATPSEYQLEEGEDQERHMKEKGKREEEKKALLGVAAKKSQKTPLFEGALTLSGLPAGRLQALMYIDEIKEKCKVRKAG